MAGNIPADLESALFSLGPKCYRHVPTGFMVHDVWSVADLLDANGALVHNVESGKWAWIAGNDLHFFVKTRGGLTLAALATEMMKQVNIRSGGLYLGGVDSAGGGSVVHVTPTFGQGGSQDTWNPAIGGRNVIFALVNNLQAGAGCSSDLINLWTTNVGINVTGSMINLDPSHVNYNAAYAAMDQIGSLDNVDNAYRQPNFVAKNTYALGRGVISLPLKSWHDYFQALADNVDNNDKSEMRARIDASIAQLDITVKKGVLGPRPTVRIPIVICTGGRVYLEENSCPNAGTDPTASNAKIRKSIYSPFRVPSMLDEYKGIWRTNPLALDPTLPFREWAFYTPNSGDIRSVRATALDLATTPKVATPIGHMAVKSFDGVNLCKVLGGISGGDPYATGADVLASTLVERAMDYVTVDSSVPGQLGNETAEIYAARMETLYGTRFKDEEGYTPKTYQFLGQPALIAALAFTSGLQSRSNLSAVPFAYLCSGHFSGRLRIVRTAAFGDSQMVSGRGWPVLPAALDSLVPGPVY